MPRFNSWAPVATWCKKGSSYWVWSQEIWGWGFEANTSLTLWIWNILSPQIARFIVTKGSYKLVIKQSWSLHTVKQQSEGNSPCLFLRAFKCKHLRNQMMDMDSLSDRPKMAAKRWQDGLWSSELSFPTVPSLPRFLRSTKWHKPFFLILFGSQLIKAIVGAPRDGGRSFQSFL